MQCPKCLHINRDGAKFCEECGEKLLPKCPKCGSELRANAKFCDECGARLGEPISPAQPEIPRLEDMHNQLQSLIPDALAQKYLSSFDAMGKGQTEQAATGENRPVTALFADISGFTPLSAIKSSEAIFSMVQDCFRQLVSIVAKYEGSISGFRGDGLLAMFGAPILHENDAERAILAAIDMREAIKAQELEVSIGINTAMMTVGEIQTQLHSEYTAYGTDINLAKRLQETAEPGQILVGSGTHRLTRRAFDFDVIPDLTVKGFSQPITAYSFKQLKVHPEKLRGIEGLRAKMIGREHEFADAKEAIDDWLAGHGQIVSIIGEAGIGKSRLVNELKEYMKKDEGGRMKDENSELHPFLEGRCVSIGQPISYWPFIDILKTYFNLSEGDDIATIARKVTDSVTQLMSQSAEETLPLLGQLLSIKFGNELDDRLKFATPEQIRHQTLMRLRDIFETLARQKPLLLILEDLHWSDDLSLDLISLLMDELANTPLMLLCVYRPEHDHRVWQLGDQASRKCMDRYTEIVLKPLSSIESRELIESLLGIDNLPEATKGMIMDRSEGNPFFIEEVIRSLIEQGMVYHEDDRWKARDEILGIDVPDTIQSVILSRVDRLQADAKYVLQCASVIGRLFKHRLLEHLTHQERELNRYISEFEERELVYRERMMPELEYAFKHALTQESTYQSILERKRKDFHIQVAQGIERLYQERLEEYYEELAHHYSQSDDTEKAVEYLLKSGDKAKRNYDNDVAISSYQKALEIIEQRGMERNEWKLEALRSLGDVYLWTGKITESVGISEDAVKLAKEMKLSTKQMAKLYYWVANSLYWQSCYDGMVKYGEMGLELLGDNDKCWEAAIMNSRIAGGYLNKGDMEKWGVYNRKNMEFVKSLPYSVELAGCYTNIIIYLYRVVKDLKAAWEWSEEYEKLAKKHNDLNSAGLVLLFQGIILNTKGDYKGAISSFRKGLEIHQDIGYNVQQAPHHYNISYDLYILGDINEAKVYARNYLIMTEKLGRPEDMALAYWQLGNIALCQNQCDEAISHCQKALKVRKNFAGTEKIAWLYFLLGRAYLRKGDYDQAIHVFDELAGRIFEFAEDSVQDGLFRLLEELEKLHRELGTREKFLEFCHSFRQQHADAVEKLALQQWYLGTAQPSNAFVHFLFDDFNAKTIDPSWVWTDMYGDCSYRIMDSGGLEICSANGYGLIEQNVSAPRLMREISGDFAIEFCVSHATKEKPQIGGLLVWKDDRNYVCFERGESDPYGFWFYGYINKNQHWAGRGLLPVESEFTYMRLERIHDEFSAYCSIDEENWLTCGKLKMQIDDPIQVGIYAHGMIDRTIYCGEYKEGTATLFSNFRLFRKQ